MHLDFSVIINVDYLNSLLLIRIGSTQIINHIISQTFQRVLGLLDIGSSSAELNTKRTASRFKC
jgi:hypothetical protein